MAKFITVFGATYSACGKGITCGSIALLMKMRGHTVQYLKFDPYLNTSASVLAPREHGEMWVCDDGTETDLDLGHQERLSNIETSKRNICTSGMLYKELLDEQEKYLGATLQVVPHLTNKIMDRMEQFQDEDIVVVEIGGTVGDMEGYHFYEAMRQFKQKYRDDVLITLVAPILWIPTIKEFKTKPLQNAVRTIQSFGIQPDVLFCRTPYAVPKGIIDKICTLTNIPRECIFEAPDVKSIYQVPIEFYSRHVDDLIADKFHLKRNGCRIQKYRDLVEKYVDSEDLPVVNVGIVGKYENGDEAYISLKEALYHSAVASNVKVNIVWINAEELEGKKPIDILHDLHGVIVPGGFDKRGVEGKIRAIKYCREKKIPFLGICLGLQCAVIEFARNVCKLEDATSMEFNINATHPVVHFVPGQEKIEKKCGTMRLGAYNCTLLKDTLAYEAYGKKNVSERHRHRYEVNPEYTEFFAKNGLIVSGVNPESNLIEIMELKKELHPFFVGTQAHPEFKSKLGNPSPLFESFIATIANTLESK